MGEASMRATGWARSFPVAGEVRAARQWCLGHLESLGWTTTAPDTVDAVLLTVSELVTNAHIHAHSSAQLVLVWDNRCLGVSVHDAGSGLPTPGTPDRSAVHGRGLRIVDALADDWETRTQADGKTVIASFRAPGTPEDATPEDATPDDHEPG
ncbi:ATP-binding protein [Kitasatospora mediocidica]|uniref:ATP-binding protein n=1 Tax=Kitasatospora mediocidica TaxID=58352 RepID=UPI00056AB441|nr:ATP-binding protein [Kitasatospora mediocidica]